MRVRCLEGLQASAEFIHGLLHQVGVSEASTRHHEPMTQKGFHKEIRFVGSGVRIPENCKIWFVGSL